MRRLLLRGAAALAAAVAVAGGTAAPAYAPKYILGSLAFGECAVGGTFEGDFTTVSFSSSGGALYATGAVSGRCLDGLDVVATVPPGVFTFPVTEIWADCAPDSTGLRFRPGTALVGGYLGADEKTGEAVKFDLALARSTLVELDWTLGDPVSLRGHVCAVAAMLRRRPPADLARVLNTLLLR